MKNTGYKYLLGKEYRTIWENDGRYYIRCGGKLFDVTDERKHWVKIKIFYGGMF